MNRWGWLWLGWWLLCQSSAHAALRLTLVSKALTPAQQQASQHLLDEAYASLPPIFIQRLDREVQVRWQTRLPDQVYGRAGGQMLELNRRYLAALTDGSAATQTTGRPHTTVHQELLATLLHELIHLYDRAVLWPSPTATQLASCRHAAQSLGLVGLPKDCRAQSLRRLTLSDDPRLLDLAGWQPLVGHRGQRDHDNGQRVRNPDTYELTNPREFVAVNMEYFLLDPSYACRRPSLYRYFRAHFAWSPGTPTCTADFPVLNAGNDFAQAPLVRLDPERIYEVDYLFAEANQEWASRWGHSMLRLVLCAPGRARGPACRLDLDQHLVLSFRAFVDDVQLSSWRGLTGEYPSRLFVLPLNQVIDEYTKMELRSLTSVPLRLSREEIRHLVERSVELHWSYDGHYYFLSNNCAVETLALLQSGVARQALTQLETILPNGLRELLVARGLADDRPLQDTREALRLGYRFDSYRERYAAMFQIIKARLGVPQNSVEDWLNTPARERSCWVEQADLRTTAALLLVEQAAQFRQLLLSRDELKRRYLNERSQSASMARADQILRELTANSNYLSRPAELLADTGYGIPQAREWQTLEQQSQVRQAQMQQLANQLDEQIRQLMSVERRAELAAIEANQAALGKHLRALHRAGGGLVLP